MMGTSSLELHWLSDTPGLWLRDADLVSLGIIFPGPSGVALWPPALLPGSVRPCSGQLPGKWSNEIQWPQREAGEGQPWTRFLSPLPPSPQLPSALFS